MRTTVADRIVGDSIAALGGVRGVDTFLHDSPCHRRADALGRTVQAAVLILPRANPRALVPGSEIGAARRLQGMRVAGNVARSAAAISAHLPLRR
jgi:hypothetical protein